MEKAQGSTSQDPWRSDGLQVGFLKGNHSFFLQPYHVPTMSKHTVTPT